ncbi:MAG: response regulator transcription factor [Thermoanaerobacterales bacterium]|nr:response regulator transcription factor [Thermoanaerobacterales bacterium]
MPYKNFWKVKLVAGKILIADDEDRMRKLVGDFLKKQGYLVVEAADGREALEVFSSEPDIDLIILDVMMPVYDGWSVCREIRKTSQVPIIMLTARGEESDELFGFDLGADEYISKPFSLKILAARVHALLRRTENTKEIKSFGDLVIDKPGRQVYLAGNRIELSPKEFDLLLYLSENAGIALSREQILSAVWDYDYLGDGRTVDTHIKKIRAKLGNKSDLIQTVRGLGYRFEVKK